MGVKFQILVTKKVGYTLDYVIVSVTSTFFIVGANLYFYLNIQIAFRIWYVFPSVVYTIVTYKAAQTYK